jgi:hypothetical protein
MPPALPLDELGSNLRRLFRGKASVAGRRDAVEEGLVVGMTAGW